MIRSKRRKQNFKCLLIEHFCLNDSVSGKREIAEAFQNHPCLWMFFPQRLLANCQCFGEKRLCLLIFPLSNGEPPQEIEDQGYTGMSSTLPFCNACQCFGEERFGLAVITLEEGKLTHIRQKQGRVGMLSAIDDLHLFVERPRLLIATLFTIYSCEVVPTPGGSRMMHSK